MTHVSLALPCASVSRLKRYYRGMDNIISQCTSNILVLMSSWPTYNKPARGPSLVRLPGNTDISNRGCIVLSRDMTNCPHASVEAGAEQRAGKLVGETEGLLLVGIVFTGVVSLPA